MKKRRFMTIEELKTKLLEELDYIILKSNFQKYIEDWNGDYFEGVILKINE